MASNDFQRFVDSFFGTSTEASKDGPDEAALSRLQGNERDEAERMLLERLGPEDSRAAIGLGLLRSKAGLARIRELMQAREDRAAKLEAGGLIHFSLACYRIDGDPKAITNIGKVLDDSPFEAYRMDAAIALRDSGAKEAEAPLWRAVENDDSGIVRNNAAKALLMMHGKMKDPKESPKVAIRLMMKPPHIREEAVRELKEMLGVG